MILSKEMLIDHFKEVEKIVTKGESRYFILIYNSHLKALEKIEELEKKISDNKIKVEITNSSEIIKDISNVISHEINHFILKERNIARKKNK